MSDEEQRNNGDEQDQETDPFEDLPPAETEQRNLSEAEEESSGDDED